LLNYIFGGGRFHIIRTEMDYIDTYLFFGVCGPIVYFYIFKNFLFNFKPKNALILLFMIVIVILGCFSSGVIFSANFALPLIVFMTYYYFESKHDVVANDKR